MEPVQALFARRFPMSIQDGHFVSGSVPSELSTAMLSDNHVALPTVHSSHHRTVLADGSQPRGT